jgi:serine/threonine protein phosphatase 1
MLNILERWKKRGKAKSRVPDGLRVYAVGDVHGCKSQMVHLLEAIERHRAGYTGSTHLIFLGDMVDRGPDSADVLNYVLTADLPADKVTFLMGNHEEMMLDCYDGNVRSFSPWLRYGGLETMESYGVTRDTIFREDFDLGPVMRSAVPLKHIAFLRSFQDRLSLGDYLFVHAGIRPGTMLEDQSPDDLRWITTDFLTDKTDHGFTVVHGHTIAPTVIRRSNRIGVDTGCYRTGILSALVLEGDENAVLVAH